MTTTGPLHGVFVVDFTQMMAGPFATQILADLGATVVKVEKPVSGEWERDLASMGEYFHGQSPFFLAMNRGKRSLGVDLKSEAGKALVRRLIVRADVVTSNFRPGTLDRLGFGYDDVKKLNPDAIYSASSGYGSSGPWVGRPGQDLLLQSVSGMLAQNGKAGDSPTPVANSVIDAITALYNVIGILAALLGRSQAINVGSVEVSMLEAAIAIQCQEISAHINLNQTFERSESGLGTPWNDAPYAVYKASDGFITIAMADLGLLSRVLGIPSLAEIAASGNTFEHRNQAKELLEATTQTMPRDVLVDLLLEFDVWCAPVLSFEEVRQLEQVRISGILKHLQHPEYGDFVSPGLPISFSDFTPGYDVAPPLPGQDSRDILRELGLTEVEMSELFDSGVVSAPDSGGDDSEEA
jgi:crotonobetainyl-CoA:carnitine CoA-transferase CaiB-like acyl-CoA transferase